jgi:hypothetical protein
MSYYTRKKVYAVRPSPDVSRSLDAELPCAARPHPAELPGIRRRRPDIASHQPLRCRLAWVQT